MSFKNYPNFVLNLSESAVKSETKIFYQFKSFRLDVEECQLFHHENIVPLTPKAFEVLAVLVENRGHLVEKDELLQTVWADSFVEEANIARIIYILRKTLGEDGNGNKFIETVAKKGYRFVAEVEQIHEKSAPANGFSESIETAELIGSQNGSNEELTSTESQSPDETSSNIVRPKTRIILFTIGFLTAVCLLFLLSFNFNSDSAKNPNAVKSIAVLPVNPVNKDNRDELYEIGISDSLINRLSGMKGFVIRPLSVTRKYSNIEQDPILIGKEQKVDYVLASNYQIADGKIRITAQLFNAANGQTEETYKTEKEMSDIFEMQDAVASEIGNKLLKLFAAVSNNPTAKRGTTNQEAFRLYLQGKHLTNQRNQADTKKAVEYFEQAVRLDPNFAPAYAEMARAYSASGSLSEGRAREAFEKARTALNKASELDPNAADVFVIRGELKLKYERDFAGAEQDLKTAVQMEPNNDLAHSNYGLLLNYQGRFEESLAEIETALEIDPNSLVYQRERGRFLYFARRYDEAIVNLERVLEIDEKFNTAYGWLWRSYELKGDHAKAFEWLIKHQKLTKPERASEYEKAYETGDWQNVRLKMLEFEKLDEQATSNFYQIARQQAVLNEKEQAFENLNKSVEKGQTQLSMLKVEPLFDSLRDDPRFDELLKRVGF